MKFAIIIHHSTDIEQIKKVQDAHRVYLRGLLDGGQLCAAGPLTDERGALWVCNADTAEIAEDFVKRDPSTAAGVFVTWDVYPLAYWSAKAAKGER